MSKDWAKRLRRSLAFSFGGTVLLLVIGWLLMHGTPSWYRVQSGVGGEQREAAARRVENQLILAKNWASQLHARETAQANAAKETPPTTVVTAVPPLAGRHTISFSEEDLNAFFEKWARLHDWQGTYQPYLSEPVIALEGKRLILAATVKELNAVVSFHFEPQIAADGRLDVQLVKIQAGRLPVPDAFLGKFRAKLTSDLTDRLADWQPDARISATGSANDAAIAAAVGKLLVQALNRQTSEPAMFLPFDERHAVPVKVTEVVVAGGEAHLTVEPMTASERTALLEKIREPYPSKDGK